MSISKLPHKSKLPQVKEDQVKKIFEQETGISASEIEEMADCFPYGKTITIHTNSRTFIGWLDNNARLKKGTLEEEK